MFDESWRLSCAASAGWPCKPSRSRPFRQAGQHHLACAPYLCHHLVAVELLLFGYDVRKVRELLGHCDVSGCLTYTHVLKCDGRGIRSP